MVNNAGQRVCHRNHVMTKNDIYVEKRKDGTVREHCKTCRKENAIHFKMNHPKYFINKNKEFRQSLEYVIKSKNDRRKYREQWIAYFKNLYGINPKCQICKRELFWEHENHGKRVCFDHRHGSESIIAKSPRTWIQNKPCDQKNIDIFMSCDFGLLCNNCNAMLPTKNRKKHAVNLVVYLEECRL